VHCVMEATLGDWNKKPSRAGRANERSRNATLDRLFAIVDRPDRCSLHCRGSRLGIRWQVNRAKVAPVKAATPYWHRSKDIRAFDVAGNRAAWHIKQICLARAQNGKTPEPFSRSALCQSFKARVFRHRSAAALSVVTILTLRKAFWMLGWAPALNTGSKKCSGGAFTTTDKAPAKCGKNGRKGSRPGMSIIQ
jgi:hypothetical protein